MSGTLALILDLMLRLSRWTSPIQTWICRWWRSGVTMDYLTHFLFRDKP
jgi:hypothetical protein